MKSSTLIGMFVFLSAQASLANDGFPDPGTVTINSFSSNGSGCPLGTVAANISPDNRALTLLFDSYILDTSETEAMIVQKNCVINMSLKAPPGWRYALFSIDYRGFADLEAGVLATQETEYAFGISGQKRIGTMEIKGPASVDYFERSTGLISELAWSDCGNGGGPDVLTISTRATIDAKPAPSSVELNLSSSRSRYTETALERNILAMELLRKDSASPCKQDRSFGFTGNKAWVNYGCRGLFKLTLEGGNENPRPQGLLTVDSIDAQLHEPGQEYGVAWQRCGEGRWVQSDGNKDCKRVCKDAGLEQGRDAFGAECASGEARPNSAAGVIQFTRGCWGGCQAQGNIKTDNQGPFCYQPGQKKDADKTDRAVGCYCK
jgi:hypothetical protein